MVAFIFSSVDLIKWVLGIHNIWHILIIHCTLLPCVTSISYSLSCHMSITYHHVWYIVKTRMGFPGGTGGKEPTCHCRREIWVQSLGWENPLKEGLAAHSRILAWRIPWTEEPGGLQSIGSHRVGHNCSDSAQHSTKTRILAVSFQNAYAVCIFSNTKHLSASFANVQSLIT